MENENNLGNSRNKLPGDCKPVSPLAGVLDYFEAPDPAQMKIAKRVGFWVGTPHLPIETITNVITKSMENTGLPDWPIVTEKLVGIVRYIKQRNRL